MAGCVYRLGGFPHGLPPYDFSSTKKWQSPDFVPTECRPGEKPLLFNPTLYEIFFFFTCFFFTRPTHARNAVGQSAGHRPLVVFVCQRTTAHPGIQQNRCLPPRL